MNGEARFAVFIMVSFVVFLGVLRLTLRRRQTRPKWSSVVATALVVVPGGMVFARWGATAGLPWWIYYTAPALVTLLLPPWVFRMARAEILEYLVLAVLMAPAIHTIFSLFLGWKEYMPFLVVPSIRELLASPGLPSAAATGL